MTPLPRLRRLNLVLRQANERRLIQQKMADFHAAKARDAVNPIERLASDLLAAEFGLADDPSQFAPPERIAANIAKLKERLGEL